MVSVRSAAAADWSEWRSLRRRALSEAPDAFGATVAEWSGEGDTEQRWRRRLDEVPVNLVAYDAGRPVGMVSVTAVEQDEMKVISMWVAPEARGSGVGEVLVRAAVAHAAAAAAKRVALNVRAGNARAYALYRRVGFVEVGWPTSPYTPHPKHRMVLDIDVSRSG